MRQRSIQEAQQEFDRSEQAGQLLIQENDQLQEQTSEITGSWRNRGIAAVIPGYFHATPAYSNREQMKLNSDVIAEHTANMSGISDRMFDLQR